MKTGGQFWFLIITVATATLVPAVLTSAEGTSEPSVIINELTWAGSSRTDHGSDDEWIELANPGNTEIPIGGWMITKNTSKEALMATLPSAATIAPGGFFVISHYGRVESILDIDPYVVAGISLSNSNLNIHLYRGDWNDKVNLVDAADIGRPPVSNYTPTPALERNLDLGGWHYAITSINLDAKTPDLGTPGAANSIVVEPPTVIGIAPAQGEVGDTLEIESIQGTNFESGLAVELRLNDVKLIAENIHVANPTLIDGGQFDLNNAALGKWDLAVINPDGQMALLPQAIEVTEPPPQYDLTSTIRLNEIYPQPNTTSNDEYIELYNSGDQTVNLAGWLLDDLQNGGSSPFTIGARNILPKTYLALYKSETKITLNDSGDSAYLIQPNGYELDHTTYTAAPRGQTWSRFDDGWKWTNSPTPNGKNVLSSPPLPPANPPAAVDEPEDIPPVLPTFQKGEMLITELLPNPNDTDEFIELYNASTRPVDLKDWVLADKSGRKYHINDFAINIQTADTLTVQPQQYVVITQTMSNIALNNTGGESVTLSDPAGNTIAIVSYPDKAPVGATYALADGAWTWSDYPTPGQMNILGLDEADEPPPQVEVVLPESLPVTGEPGQRWWGIALASLALNAIVFWNYVKRRHPQFD